MYSLCELRYRNTEEHICALAQKIYDCFNTRRKCAALFADFSSAYDRVVIPALMCKLERICCSPNLFCWLAAYLRDRRARGRFNESLGRCWSLGCGLPQGSSLSPSLWNIYVHDLQLGDSNIEQLAFADADGSTWDEVSNIGAQYTKNGFVQREEFTTWDEVVRLVGHTISMTL